MRPLLISLVLVAIAHAGDWPAWRGPTGQGHSPDKGLPVNWGGKDNANVRWKSPLIPGAAKVRFDQNQSSPIIRDGRTFVTLSYWPADVNPEKEPPEHHVVAFRATDGERLWDTKVPPGPWLLKDLRGGYSAPTPTSDAERIYVLFGSSVAAALDRDGKIVWRKELTPHAFDVAMGVSPVLVKDMVVLAWDQTNKTSRLIALDAKSGDIRWEKKRPTVEWGHSTPTLAEVKGKPQLLVAGATALEGVDPNTGDILWSCNSGDSKPARIGDTLSPVLAGGIVYIDSGRGGTGIAVDPTGTGDVTKTHIKWKLAKVPDNSIGSPVAMGDYLYRLQNPDVLKCYRLSDGKEQYSERLNGASAIPSPVATADGRIYFVSGGRSFVIQAGPKLDLLGTNDLGDFSQASPAVADGRLFIKGGRSIYCIGAK